MSIAASAECLVCAGANGKLYLFRIHPEFQRINNFCTITLCTREIWCIQICKGLLRNGDLFVGTDTGELINLDCRMPSLFRTVVDYFDASIYCMTHHVDLNRLALGIRYRDHAVVKILTTTNWSCVAHFDFREELRIDANVWAIAFNSEGTSILVGLDGSEGLLLVCPDAQTQRIKGSRSRGSYTDITRFEDAWFASQSGGCIRSIGTRLRIDATYEISDGVADNDDPYNVPRYDVYCLACTLWPPLRSAHEPQPSRFI